MSKVNNVRSGSGIKQPTQQNGERLGENSVASEHIQDLAVTEAKFGNDVISTVKLQNNAVTAAKVASDVATTSGTQDFSNKTIVDSVTLQEIATPSNPASGDMKLYPKSDENIHILDSSGNEKRISGTTTTLKGNTGYTATIDDDTILCANSVSLNITLPSAALAVRPLTIAKRKGTSDHFLITIIPAGGAGIDNILGNKVLYNSGDSITLVSDGTNWFTKSYSFGSESTEVYGGNTTITAFGASWQNLGSFNLGHGDWLINFDVGYNCNGGATGISTAISIDSLVNPLPVNTLGLNKAFTEVYAATTDSSSSIQNYKTTISSTTKTIYLLVQKTVNQPVNTNYWRMTATRVNGNF